MGGGVTGVSSTGLISGTDVGCSSSALASSSVCSSIGGSSGVISEPTLSTDMRFHDVGGGLPVTLSVVLPVVLAVPLGGHSRFSRDSTRAASVEALQFEEELSDRAPGGVVAGLALCCSKRPMRFWTLGRGRSSGSGLQE
jgi:hypothetical protein